MDQMSAQERAELQAPAGQVAADGWAKHLPQSIRLARQHLLSLQEPDGHWCAELEGDTILESEYVLLLHFLGRTNEERVQKAANYLRARQQADGGWGGYPGAGADVNTSAKAYFVLKLVGDDPAAEHMVRAREVIRRKGGLHACNSFTKIYLSVFGQYRWDKSPGVPPELVLLPLWFPINIYDMSSWSRAIVVPLSIIWAHKPNCPVPGHAAIPELLVENTRRAVPQFSRASLLHHGWSVFFQTLDRIHKRMESWHLMPLRGIALKRAEAWILPRLEKSDGLGAIFPPIVNTIMALRCLGYPADHPIIQAQARELEKLEIEEGDTLRLEPCKSPVWETALSINALGELDQPEDKAKLEKAVEWLLASGFQPRRTIYLAFGHDEEVGGAQGAAQIAIHLRRQGIRLQFVLDEGMMVTEGIVPGVADPVALVGIAEKGYADVELVAAAAGGHTSVPPSQTAAGILAGAIARLERSPMPALLAGPARQLFEYVRPEMSLAYRVLFSNLWLFEPFILRQLAAQPATNAVIRTTAAPTMLRGSNRPNVLPASAAAVVNFRMLPGDTIDDVLEHVRRTVNDARVTVQLYRENSQEPSKQSSIDSSGYTVIERSIREVFAGAVVAPALVVAATDARHYAPLATDVYRFAPLRVSSEDLVRFHGLNERIAVADYANAVRFYVQLVRNAAN